MKHVRKRKLSHDTLLIVVSSFTPYKETVVHGPSLHKLLFFVKVKTLYPYAGHGLEVKKGEVMFLLDKTNSDWWNIRKSNGDNGYVPANYVKEVEPKIVSVEVKKPVTVKDVRKVRIDKEIRMV